MKFVYPRDFYSQFVVGADLSAQEGETLIQGASHSVVLQPGMPSATVRDAVGPNVGVLLGTPLDIEAGKVVKQEYVASSALTGDNIDEFVEEEIYRLGGSVLFVIDSAFASRVYLDAFGSLSVVYDPT
jgi:hypothetical protein